jgi:hypothetical protein
MPNKNVLLFATLIVLGGIYIWKFTDWFNKPEIAISPRIRFGSADRRSSSSPGEIQVSFSFDTKVQLTEVKVFSVAEMETNKYPHAVWHLFSESNSVPVKGLLYGQNITGMKPKIPKMKAEPLKPQNKYRLIIEAGKYSGKAEFEIPPPRVAGR